MSYTEDQYEQFCDKMEKTYPKMFQPGYGGFAIGAGWWPIIESLCARIQQYTNWKNKDVEQVEQVKVTQIKEKFGGLRFYYDGGDSYVDGLVDMAEEWAGKTCEMCGKPGHSRGGGWIRTLCDEHEAERQNAMKERFGDEE